ncbi:MAG: polysaccharide pyruvyl transferase CsaB [Firmicutes bacterium]|nr:polysaccharide pyruvyl transferase CsaB [Bacillota bacterium]
MLRVAVSGYYGFNNTGDEAILLALVSTLRTLAPGIEITVFSHRPRETRRLYGVKAVNRWNPLSICWALFRSDLLLSGGGGLLQDVTGVRSICYYLGIVLLARLLGKPVIYYAQGVGPIRTRFGRWLTRVVSNRVELITVRDQASREDFLSMGVTRPPIVVTADPALALSPGQVDPEPGEALLADLRAGSEGKGQEKGQNPAPPEEKGRRRRLGIALRDWQDCCRYKREVAAAADRLVREGWEVVLIPFHFPVDLQVCQEVCWLMQEPALLVRSKLSVETLFSLLSRLDLVLAMRLHALIMASVMRTPCVGISYDPKVERFLELTGQPLAGRVADLDAEKIYLAVNDAWERCQEITTRLDQVLVNLRQQAWESASLALSVFYSRFPHRRWEVGRATRRGA